MNHIHFFHGIREHRNGFTLTEVVIAMTILSIALMALISVTASVIKGNSFNKKMTTATTLAKDQMETLKSSFYGSIESSTDYPAWLPITDFPGYERRWQVTSISVNNSCSGADIPYACCTGSNTGTCPSQKSIDMDVRWQLQGAFHQVTLNTIVVP